MVWLRQQHARMGEMPRFWRKRKSGPTALIEATATTSDTLLQKIIHRFAAEPRCRSASSRRGGLVERGGEVDEEEAAIESPSSLSARLVS